MGQTNEDIAKELVDKLDQSAEDWRAAAIVYALLAVADRLLDLAVAVETAGFHKE